MCSAPDELAFLTRTRQAFFSNSLFNSPLGGRGTASGSQMPPESSDALKKKFWVTFAVVSVTTYLVAGLLMLWSTSQLRDEVKSVFTKTRSKILHWELKEKAENLNEPAVSEEKSARQMKTELKDVNRSVSQGWRRIWRGKHTPESSSGRAAVGENAA